MFTPSLGLFDTLHHGMLATLPVSDGLREFDISDDGSNRFLQVISPLPSRRHIWMAPYWKIGPVNQQFFARTNAMSSPLSPPSQSPSSERTAQKVKQLDLLLLPPPLCI